jgi:hypothetical protein
VAIKVKLGRIDVVTLVSFAEPILTLPQKTAEVLGAFYNHLSSRQNVRLEDLQSFGGTNYAEVKLSIRTFGNKGRIDITPNSLGMVCADLIGGDDDVRALKDYLQACEDIVVSTIGAKASERTFRASAWLECEGGFDVVDATLGARGEAAFKFDGTEYAAYERHFKLQSNLNDASRGINMTLSVERSRVPRWHLFLECDFAFKPVASMPSLSEQFDVAESEFQRFAKHLNLESQ